MIRVEVPGAPPLLLNARLHWREIKRLKKKWYAWVHLALGQQVPPEPFRRACVRYVRYCGVRRPDRDNLVSGFKWIQDALVRSGVFVDDTEETLITMHEWFPASPLEKRVVIEILPVYHHPDDCSDEEA